MEDLGGYVTRGMSKSVRPLCHQEVDAGMKDRRENIPFFGAHNPLGMLVCHFFGCLWTRPGVGIVELLVRSDGRCGPPRNNGRMNDRHGKSRYTIRILINMN